MRLLWLLSISLPLALAAEKMNVWGVSDPDAKAPPLDPADNPFLAEKIPPPPERQTYLRQNFNRYLKGICRTCVQGKARAEQFRTDLNMEKVALRCQMLANHWMQMLDVGKLYMEAYPDGEDRDIPMCDPRDSYSRYDDGFINAEHRQWLYDLMHLDENGQKKPEKDTDSVFRSALLPQSGMGGVSPAMMASAGQRRRMPVEAGQKGNMLKLNMPTREVIGKNIQGMSDMFTGGVKKMATSSFWSSAAAGIVGGGSVTTPMRFKPGYKPV
ncbi:MAG: hypothetical protein M1823_002174 [Watsoniomyces obsoletus]|nr:MAG: hypothetical protein M1823_002174 [Watsoniomyces obsoletus]